MPSVEPWKTEYHLICGDEVVLFPERDREVALGKAESLSEEFPNTEIVVLKAVYYPVEYEEVWKRQPTPAPLRQSDTMPKPTSRKTAA